MPKEARLNFNRGLISKLALGRADLDRTGLSASIQTNWMPRVFGSAMLRPGTKYICSTRSNAKAKYIPFVFSSADTALIEMTDSVMRVLVNEAPIVRPAVTTAVTNGTFAGNLNNWTDADESGATSSYDSGGYMSLVGSGYNRAIRTQQVTTVETGVEHALRITVVRGPVVLRVGSTAGGEEYVAQTSLGTGVHSLAFTPSGDFHIHLSSKVQRAILVDSVVVEGAGAMELPTPWNLADLPLIRHTASGDVTYCACEGRQQRKIERRATRSWSIVKYEPIDGPFRVENVSSLQMTPSGLSGNITLTASVPIFKSTHVGALFSVDSVGQKASQVLTGENQWSDEVRVTGVEATRQFLVTITGTWSGTVTLQRSVSEPGAWVDVVTYNANANAVYDDNLDNQICYYRVGINTGDYTSGSATASVTFSGGSLTGIVRVTGFTSSTLVSVEVLQNLGGTTASDIWSEGAWSDYRGWPTSVGLYEGRLWWAGKNKQWGSISDAYESFDDTLEGDAGPISRSIGEGPIDGVNWIIALERLVISTAGAEYSAKSSSFDEPLTPTGFSLKRLSTQGSAKIAPVAVDSEGLYVQRGTFRVYSLTYDADRYNYGSVDMTALVPELGSPGIVHLAVQRQPDTRVHCVRSDGNVAVLVYDRIENVKCWVLVETDGEVEDVVVLPGDEEDAVYYVVNRSIESGTVRYLERWSKESECRGGVLSKCADSHVVYNVAPTLTLTGLSHLEGKSVVVWGEGADRGTYTVDGGQITVVSETLLGHAVVGLGYTADYQSTKLKEFETAKRIHHITLVAADMHAQGIQYGQDFDHLDDLPLMEGGTEVLPDHVWDEYHQDLVEVNGEYDVDARVCLRATAPRPATILAFVVEYS